MKQKQVVAGLVIALGIIVGAAATSHAAAGDGDHSGICLACSLCEMVHSFLHG